MVTPKRNLNSQELVTRVLSYVQDAPGLDLVNSSTSSLLIHQRQDKQNFSMPLELIDDVVPRTDENTSKPFLQVNFCNSTKLLITEHLIGFKPYPVSGLDLGRLPRVVTTPDLQIVKQALIELYSGEGPLSGEGATLRKAYIAILTGAERVGFELPEERTWIAGFSPFTNFTTV